MTELNYSSNKLWAWRTSPFVYC